jgi:hypothetical protein
VAPFTELQPLFDNTGSAATVLGNFPGLVCVVLVLRHRRARRSERWRPAMPHVINTAALFAALYAAVLLMKFV